MVWSSNLQLAAASCPPQALTIQPSLCLCGGETTCVQQGRKVVPKCSVSKWVFKKSPIRKTIKCCLLIQNRPPRCFLGISMTSRWFAFRHIISQSSITYIAFPRSRTTIFKDCPPRASCKQSRFQPQALSLYKTLANLEVTWLFR